MHLLSLFLSDDQKLQANTSRCIFRDHTFKKNNNVSLRTSSKEDSVLSLSNTGVGCCKTLPMCRVISPYKLLTENWKATRHVFMMNAIIFAHLLSSLDTRSLFLYLQSPATRAMPSAAAPAAAAAGVYLRGVPLSDEPLALVSSASVTGPLLFHQFTNIHMHTHTHKHTQAGARSITPGRAHDHCAHCSAAADVWWPQGTEPSSQNVIQRH